jgi:hypothetical protein
MIRFVIILLLGVALVSCEKTLDFTITNEPPIVVSALFSTDSTWRVRVEKAWSDSDVPTVGYHNGMDTVYQSPPMGIEDAAVEITSGSGEQITLAYDPHHGYYNGYYISPLKPRAGESYNLSVNVPGKPLLSASAMLSKPAEIDTVYISDYIPGTSNRQVLMTVEFTDVPGLTTYEIIAWNEFYYPYFNDIECDDPEVHLVTYWTEDDSRPERGIFLDQGPYVLSISDWNFQGKKKKIQFRLNTTAVLPGHENYQWGVTLRTLSHEWEQYRATSQLLQNGNQDPFSAPVKVFNNMTNGVGIFAGYSVSTYQFTRKLD